ncbi:LysR family transcriptional regulator [Microbacterium sp. VKM Ac-2870]|uniref:LysR family transcriptional regulator n=1 Tax=Microbacterium sp. VKM Ac-2870 TaxID=2783825 RepID=UPI00188A43B4|nr:LysR family transcriptional regulator [Microbacterium sp. VKM Ac-2870]MBF4562812.1 LysR family transcriptional regulator [Microbacterium sp. VKM Ac-2870]
MDAGTRYTLRQLELFAAAAEHGSFSAAADALYLTPNAVALAVRDLETALGAHLAVRQRAVGMSLTPAGVHLLDRAKKLLREADDLYWSVSDNGGPLRGPVTVGCYSTLAPTILPPLMETIRREAPDIALSIVDGPVSELLPSLLSGGIDVMISYGFSLPPELEQVQLSETEIHVILPESHRLADSESVHLEQLVDDPLILLDHPPSSDHTLGMLARAGATPNVAYRTSNFELVRSLVARGLGYSLLIQRPAIDESYEGLRIVSKRIEPTLSRESVVISWPRSVRLTARARAVVDHAHSAVAGQNWYPADPG